MDIHPKKSLGQNFLVNPHILDKIVSAAELSKDDTVLEVGPGTGNLTKKIAEKAGRVIAIEKDKRLIDPWKETLTKYPNIEIIEGDALKFKIEDLNLPPSYKIVANIPYYITSNLLRAVFETWPQPKLIVLTIQKEVAERIIAKPPHMNLLAISVQYYSEPKIVLKISKNNFRPIPKVDSAIIKLTPKQVTEDRRQEKLFELVRAGFSEKRKQLANNLSKNLKISKENVIDILFKAGLKKDIRAENLQIWQWIELAKLLE